MTTHELKVIPPYFDALVSGSKTFEVRKNDRAFQRGDRLKLREWHVDQTDWPNRCPHEGCTSTGERYGHWAGLSETVNAEVTYVYAGDPRFGGIESGYVVLGFRKVSA